MPAPRHARRPPGCRPGTDFALAARSDNLQSVAKRADAIESTVSAALAPCQQHVARSLLHSELCACLPQFSGLWPAGKGGWFGQYSSPGSGVAAHDQPGRPMLAMAGGPCSYGEGRLRTLGSSGRPARLRRRRRPGVAQHIALPSPKFAAVTLRNCPAAAAHTATAAGQLRPQPGSRQPDSDVAGTHDDFTLSLRCLGTENADEYERPFSDVRAGTFARK